MTAKDVLRASLDMGHMVLTQYLSDLTDAELLLRPVPGANHVAWQVGHLISAEAQFLGLIPGATAPELPAGFHERHATSNTKDDGPAGFATKAEYLELFTRVRAATSDALARIADADLDQPIEGRLARIAPNVGRLFFLMGNHEMMHAGQLAVLRRKLGKPVLI